MLKALALLLAVPVSSLNSQSNSSAPTSQVQWKPAKKLNLMVQNSPLAMIEWDSDLVILDWNPAAAELFSFFEDEAIGQRIDTLLAQRQITDLEAGDWMRCDRAGVLREYVSLNGKKRCRWFNTPFIKKGQRVGTLSTIVEVPQATTGSNEELRAQLQSRTKVLKHTTTRLKLAMAERAQTHAALSDSELRFQNLATHVPGVVYQFCLRADGSYDIPYLSRSCQGIYELAANVIQSDPKKLLDMVDADDRLSLELAMRQSAKTLSTWHSEHRLTTPSGQTKWVRIDSKPQATETGDILWSGIAIDITARKQIDQKLQADHTFLNNLINGIADPVFVKDHNHQLILLNDAYCKFVGRSREDVIGKTDYDFMPKEKADAIWKQNEQLFADGKPQTSESDFINSCNQRKFIFTTKTRFQSLNNQPYLLGNIRDLTEQVTTQKALEKSEKRLKKITANVPGILYQFQLDPDLAPSFPFFSADTQSILGLPASTIQADASLLLNQIHPEDRDSFHSSVAESAKTLQDWRWQGRVILDSGDSVWIQAISRPERRSDNSIVWDGLLIDISPLKRTQTDLQASEAQLRSQTIQLKETLKALKATQVKLIQSEKMSSLGQLVAGIAHEINNPVNFIHGNLAHVNSYAQDMQTLIRLYQAHYPTPNSDYSNPKRRPGARLHRQRFAQANRVYSAGHRTHSRYRSFSTELFSAR